MNKDKSAAQYSVEILTASPSGFQAFVDKLAALRSEHPVTMRLGRDGDGRPAGAQIAVTGMPFKVAPLSPMTSDSEIGKYVGHLNRTINPARVTEYRWAMSSGQWWFTPDPVVVTDEGHIINGQHRLMAVEELINDDVREANRSLKGAIENLKLAKDKNRTLAHGPFDSVVEAARVTEWLEASPAERIRKAREEVKAAKDELAKLSTRQWPQFVVVWGVDKRAAILMDESRRSATDRRDIAMRYAASR